MRIDTLVMIIAEQNGGKSNQMRSIFEEHELHGFYGGYPKHNNIARHYYVAPDMELYMRLASWHERNQDFTKAESDLRSGCWTPRRRYKVFVPAQVSATAHLVGGEELFIKLMTTFDVRRGFAVWLNPDRTGSTPFRISQTLAAFLSGRKDASALAIDSLAAHPSASPTTNSINARLLCDLLFRV